MECGFSRKNWDDFFFLSGKPTKKGGPQFYERRRIRRIRVYCVLVEISLTLLFLFIFTFFPEKGETRKARSSQRFRCEMLFFALDDVTFHRVSGTGLPL